jgi:ATP-binding cassette, subfamily A (ABC1), member 3
MDECEAICTRIGILVSGQFKCLGSAQHLKNKYSKGFVITIKMTEDDENLVREIESRVTNEFGQSTKLKEKYLKILTFHTTNTELKWSQMFGILARLKNEMAISDYALTQMTLEQVFLVIAKKFN